MRSFGSCVVLVTCIAAGLFGTAPLVFAQSGGLVARIPSDANTLVVIRVDDVLNTPLAKKQDWRGKQEAAAAAGLTTVSPSAAQYLSAAQLDLEFMQPVWQVIMADLKYDPSLPKIAAQWNGEIDRILNRTAVRLSDDSYVVQFGKNLLGAYRPGNRQSVTRWIQTTDKFDNRLSPYLKSALEYSDKGGTPIIMAIDLSNAISEDLLRSRLAKLESLKNRNLDQEKLVKALASIQGVTLGITISDHVHGAVKVDFSEDVSFLGDVAKPLLLEVLANQSAMVDEFNDWNLKVDGNRIQISGDLYRSGLTRILSITDVPESLQREAGASSGEVAEADLQRIASQQYFKSISGYLDDLKDRPNVSSLGQLGTWINRYADKIDKLPMLNVDPALLDYGRYVSAALRDAAEALRGIAGKSRVRELENPNSYVYYGRWGTNGGYGGYVQDVKAQQQDRTRIRTEERIGAAEDARGIMQEVKNVSAEVRAQMTQKYKAEF